MYSRGWLYTQKLNGFFVVQAPAVVALQAEKMCSCVAAPVAVIPSLLLGALSAALQRRARRLVRCTRCCLLRCCSCKTAHLVCVAAVLVACPNPCDSICTTNYQTAISPKLASFKRRAEGRKSKPKRGVYCVMPMAPLALALPPAWPRKVLGTNNVQRCTGALVGVLMGALLRCRSLMEEEK